MFGFRYRFGGGRSQAFVLIYESVDSMMKYEPKYRLIRKGVVEKPKITKARKTKKEEKNRLKKVRGTAKVKGDKKKKKWLPNLLCFHKISLVYLIIIVYFVYEILKLFWISNKS